MKKPDLFIFLGIICALFAIAYLFTRPNIIDYFGFSSATDLANIVNSLTAPIIAIVGAILIYISFKEQVKANSFQFRALNEQRELDLMYRFYEELKNDLLRIQNEYGVKNKQPDILDSFMNYVYDDRQGESPYPDLSHFLNFVFNQFQFVGKRIQRARNLSKSERVYFIDKVDYLYKLYFDHYYLRLGSKLVETQFSQEFKASLSEVHKMILELRGVHGEEKQHLRDEALSH